jgi:uncharacterized protein YoxC
MSRAMFTAMPVITNAVIIVAVIAIVFIIVRKGIKRRERKIDEINSKLAALESRINKESKNK